MLFLFVNIRTPQKQVWSLLLTSEFGGVCPHLLSPSDTWALVISRYQCILTAVCTTKPVWMWYDCYHCCMAWLRQNLAENNIILLSISTVSHN